MTTYWLGFYFLYDYAFQSLFFSFFFYAKPNVCQLHRCGWNIFSLKRKSLPCILLFIALLSSSSLNYSDPWDVIHCVDTQYHHQSLPLQELYHFLTLGIPKEKLTYENSTTENYWCIEFVWPMITLFFFPYLTGAWWAPKRIWNTHIWLRVSWLITVKWKKRCI